MRNKVVTVVFLTFICFSLRNGLGSVISRIRRDLSPDLPDHLQVPNNILSKVKRDVDEEGSTTPDEGGSTTLSSLDSTSTNGKEEKETELAMQSESPSKEDKSSVVEAASATEEKEDKTEFENTGPTLEEDKPIKMIQEIVKTKTPASEEMKMVIKQKTPNTENLEVERINALASEIKKIINENKTPIFERLKKVKEIKKTPDTEVVKTISKIETEDISMIIDA